MPERKTIQEYLQIVEDQIRWKRAKPVVTQELERHLEDQRDAFAEEGSAPEEAERLAVEEMGDPVAVGTELDRIHRPRTSWEIFIPVLLSLAVWLGFRVFQRWGVSYLVDYYFPRWGGTVALALGVIALLYFLDYTLLGKRPMLAAGLVTAAVFGRSLLEVTLPYFSYTHNVGDYLSLLMPLAMALSIYALREKGTPGLAACCILGLVSVLPWIKPGWFYMLWPSLLCNTALLILAVKSGWFGGKKRNWLLVWGYALAMLGAILLAAAILTDGEMLYFIRMAIHADKETQIGYRAWYSREMVSHARLVGMAAAPAGWPEGVDWRENLRLTLRFANYEDMLLAILSNFGWLAFLAVQAPVAALLGIGWRRCRQQTAVLGRLLSVAILLTLTWQASAYVLQTLTGLFDDVMLTPFPYPLISDGGTALVIDCALLGLLLSVFRNGSVVREDSRGRSYIPRRNRLAIDWQNSQNHEKILTVSLILKKR